MEHSILMAGQILKTEEIYAKLTRGTNIIWFGNKKDNSILAKDARFKIFIDNYFLSIFELKEKIILKITNGTEIKKYQKELERLENGDNNFNLKQYMIEHDNDNALVIVKAGAGSGKTFVMTNRLLYLLHTKEEIHLKDIAMITFTNKATDSMRHKFIQLLRTKLFVVKDIEIRKKYLTWIEEVPQMTISTIHSFFKKIVLEVGPMLGYGTNLRMSSLMFEKRKILRDIMDKKFANNNETVMKVLGLPIHVVENLAIQFWKKIENNGMSGYEVAVMDWGSAATEQSRNIQDTLVKIFEEVEEKYNYKKLEYNTISMSDIIHEFNRVRNDTGLKEYITSHYKYIFCDEFQDSDDIQIQTIVALDKLYDGKLFVVGDIKQSIYRFRGATDSAFMRLDENMKRGFGNQFVATPYSLSKNYRTSKDILGEIDSIFRKWKDNGLLQYNYIGNESDVLTAQNKEKGIYKQIPVFSKKNIEEKFKALIRKIDKNNRTTITVLTRNNQQLKDISNWCKDMKRVFLIKERGTFFNAIAVKEFCSFIEAVQYPAEPMYLYNILRSAYGSYKKIDMKEVVKFEGAQEKLTDYFKGLINEEYDWERLQDEFRNKPVMTVLYESIVNKKPSFVYGAWQKQYYLKLGYDVNEATKQAILDAKQYEADLQKLLQLIASQFSDEFSSLCDICNYLRNKIATDRDEDQAEVIDLQDINPIMGFTVHAAKGLEFEHVILPFTNEPFRQNFRSEILVDKETNEVGWKYYDYNNKNEICNDLYKKLLVNELQEINGDETRLLYVAMTRAIKGLYCFTWRKQQSEMIWAKLLPEDRDDENYL